jgi:alpha-beta hydrolase superfamily lysophospholipase
MWVEAVDIGSRIGDQVVLVGNSTGATLISWYLATQDPQNVAAAVLLSPNFEPRDTRTRILLWPWGGYLADLLVGSTRSWEPHNDLQARFWTTSYPTRALMPMMGIVDLVSSLDFRSIDMPLLMLYSKDDSVVNVEKVEDTFEQFGAVRKALISVDTEDPSGHILAGDIMSPTTTDEVSRAIESFLAAVFADPNWLIVQR